MTSSFLLLIYMHCSVDWFSYRTDIEEQSDATFIRCVYNQIKCYESRGESFCSKVMRSYEVVE